jgi:hypothetical protein
MDIETSVYYVHLTWLIAREDFIKLGVLVLSSKLQRSLRNLYFQYTCHYNKGALMCMCVCVVIQYFKIAPKNRDKYNEWKLRILIHAVLYLKRIQVMVFYTWRGPSSSPSHFTTVSQSILVSSPMGLRTLISICGVWLLLLHLLWGILLSENGLSVVSHCINDWQWHLHELWLKYSVSQCITCKLMCTRSLVSPGFVKQIISGVTSYDSLVTWMFVCLTTAKFKLLALSVSGFAWASVTDIDFHDFVWLLLATCARHT